MIERLQLLLNYRKSNQHEPPIGNYEFLDSFLRLGSWLRLVTAERNLQVAMSSEATPIQKYAAAIGIYENLGMLHEDVATSLVAWAAWAKNRDFLLADLYARIQIKRSERQRDERVPYHDLILERFMENGRRVQVDPAMYANSLGSMLSESIVAFLGILWRTHQSTTDIPSDARERWAWDDLPELANYLVSRLAEKSSDLVTSGYNKLKHGPQIVLMNVRNVGISRRSLDSAHVEASKPDADYVRLLLAGARTQERSGELESGLRVAPFLLHDAYFLDKLVHDVMLHVSFAQNRVAYWLLRTVIRQEPSAVTDPGIVSIIQRAKQRKNHTKEGCEAANEAAVRWRRRN